MFYEIKYFHAQLECKIIDCDIQKHFLFCVVFFSFYIGDSPYSKCINGASFL